LSILLYGDALAGIIVSVIVMKVGYNLIKSSATIILEKVLDDDKVKPYVETVEATKGVLKVDELLARTHGRYIIIDIRLSVDPFITVTEGHDIATDAKRSLLQRHPEIEDVLVHVNPYYDNS